MLDSQIYLYSFGSVLLVSLISLIGLFTFPMKEKSLEKTLLFLVSFLQEPFLAMRSYIYCPRLQGITALI